MIVGMVWGFLSLYHKTVQSGILLEGTWQGDGIIIKIDGKTAEFYRSGAAEAAVLNIYGVQDRLLREGEIEYCCELCFEKRITQAKITYINHEGRVSLVFESVSQAEGEAAFTLQRK